MAVFSKGQRRRLPRCQAINYKNQRCAFRGSQYVGGLWVCGCHANPGAKAWTTRATGVSE